MRKMTTRAVAECVERNFAHGRERLMNFASLENLVNLQWLAKQELVSKYA
jgi:hypothetical protein